MDIGGRSASRLTSLDGLRGVASLVVVIGHGLATIPSLDRGPGQPYTGDLTWLMNSPLHIFFAGGQAVVVFFVLSGLVLTLPYVDRRRYGNWRSYYPARIIRLYLPVLASLCFAVLLLTLFPRDTAEDASYFVRSHEATLSLTTVLKDGLLILGVSELNGPLWSLRWEVLFSLLLPAYVWIGYRTSSRPTFALLAVAAAAGVSAALGLPALPWLLMFAIGVLMALRMDHVQAAVTIINASAIRPWVWSAATVACVLATTSSYTLGQSPAVVNGVTATLSLAAAGGWVFIALGSELARRILNLRPIQFLGMVSFSLYLVHEPLVIAIAQFVPASERWMVAPLSVVLAIVVAYLFYGVIERPSQLLSQRVRAALRTDGQRTPVASA